MVPLNTGLMQQSMSGHNVPTSTILHSRVFTLQYLGDYPSHTPMNFVVIFEVIVGISLSRFSEFENYPLFVDDVIEPKLI